MRVRWMLSAALFLPLFTSGCVSKGSYDECVRSADAAKSELARTQRSANMGRTSMQKELDDATAIDDELSKQLAKVGQDAQSLLAVNGTLKSALESSRRRLEELRRAQGAAESRAALYRDLALKFKSMIDAGDLAITLRNGRMVLRLSNDVLFDSGRSELKPDGERAIAQIAAVLSTIEARHFQVAGHTDTDPIKHSPYKSNWDLSTARALAVTSFLIGHGVEPTALSAAGYGEFDAVDGNDTPEGKAKNRRTEITLQPNIDEMVAVPESP